MAGHAIWLQTQHEVGSPAAGVQQKALFSAVSMDRTERERATVVTVRGTLTVAGLRTAAGNGILEVYCGLVAMHENMDTADIQVMDADSSVAMGWLWKSHIFTYLAGDGTNPVNVLRHVEPVYIRSKRSLKHGLDLFSVVETVTNSAAVASVNLRANILVNIG